MNIEQIMLEVETEFGLGGLSDGICIDFALEVSKRAALSERERWEAVLIDLLSAKWCTPEYDKSVRAAIAMLSEPTP